MRVLVTGAAGFIGFHVAKRLVADGHEVVAVDGFQPLFPILKHARAVQGQEHRVVVLGRDLADWEQTKEVFEARKPEVVVHLAAQAGVRHSMIDPWLFVKNNLAAFTNVLEACKQTGVWRLVYASSSSVYGGCEEMPFREDARLVGPISFYAATKMSNEAMAMAYHKSWGLDCVGLRFFSVYGPWGRPDMALWIFTEKVLRGESLPFFNGGDMKRDWTWIGDIVEGISRVCFAENLGGGHRILNIGAGRPEDLLRMAELIEQTLDRRVAHMCLPMQVGDVKVSWADTTKLSSLVGYKPKVTIDEGVPAFVRWYLDNAKLVDAVREERASMP